MAFQYVPILAHGTGTRFPDASSSPFLTVTGSAERPIGYREQHARAVAHYRVVCARREDDVDVAEHFEFAGFAVDVSLVGQQDEAGSLRLRAARLVGYRVQAIDLAEGRNEKYR